MYNYLFCTTFLFCVCFVNSCHQLKKSYFNCLHVYKLKYVHNVNKCINLQIPTFTCTTFFLAFHLDSTTVFTLQYLIYYAHVTALRLL